MSKRTKYAMPMVSWMNTKAVDKQTLMVERENAQWAGEKASREIRELRRRGVVSCSLLSLPPLFFILY